MKSLYRPYWVHTPMLFPEFTEERIMMMPVILGSLEGVPSQYEDIITKLFGLVEHRHIGKIGYLTIDEKEFLEEGTHRREGWHVDGYYKGNCGAWGGGGSWGSTGNGMIVISNIEGCESLLGEIPASIGDEGAVNHLPHNICPFMFEAGIPYWVDGACIHRSVIQPKGTKRQFIRLSMPNNGPWFKGYTENPTGIKPSGEILPERSEFMGANI